MDTSGDAGLGRLLLIQKHGFTRKCEVNAGLHYLGHAEDGAFQFAFERPLMVDVLHQFGGAEIGLVEEFESDSSRLG